jgi:hypothetical protein
VQRNAEEGLARRTNPDQANGCRPEIERCECDASIKILLYSRRYLNAITEAIHDSREVMGERSSLGLPIAAE